MLVLEIISDTLSMVRFCSSRKRSYKLHFAIGESLNVLYATFYFDSQNIFKKKFATKIFHCLFQMASKDRGKVAYHTNAGLFSSRLCIISSKGTA